MNKIKTRKRNQGSDMILAVAGCVAQAEGDELIHRAPFVDLVFGPQAYHNLPEMIARLSRAKGAFPSSPSRGTSSPSEAAPCSHRRRRASRSISRTSKRPRGGCRGGPPRKSGLRASQRQVSAVPSPPPWLAQPARVRSQRPDRREARPRATTQAALPAWLAVRASNATGCLSCRRVFAAR